MVVVVLETGGRGQALKGCVNYVKEIRLHLKSSREHEIVLSKGSDLIFILEKSQQTAV